MFGILGSLRKDHVILLMYAVMFLLKDARLVYLIYNKYIYTTKAALLT